MWQYSFVQELNGAFSMDSDLRILNATKSKYFTDHLHRNTTMYNPVSIPEPG